MLEMLAAVAAFTAVFALAMYMFSRAPGRRNLEARLATLSTPVAEEMNATGVLRRQTGTFSFLRPMSNSRWAERSAIELQQAGLALKVSEYFLLRLMLGALLGVLLLLLLSSSSIGVLLAIGAGVGGFMVPAWYVKHLRSRRISRINTQLVETLQLIANALRSGFAFTQAVEMAIKQVEPPIRDELERYIQDSQLGSRQDEALKQVVVRTGSLDVEMMVTTILVQRTTGGNLSEILENVAETIRERERLQGEIRALTSSQRLTGLILSIYPFLMLAFFTLIAYDLMSVLWTEALGRFLLGVAIVLQLIGIFVIQRILKLDV
jgi:tight adherence protein B